MAYSKETTAAKLRGLRAERRMSQDDVARRIGASVGTIRNYENAVTDLSFENAWSLADLYGVSLCDLCGRDETPYAKGVGA